MKNLNILWISLLVTASILLLITNSCEKVPDDTSILVTDVDGNVYHTVTIGTQIWMVENLRTTKYNDGNNIPSIDESAAWSALTAPGTCTYNNTTNDEIINRYGRLYNWYSVNTGMLCPPGWHVPTDAEWTILDNYLMANGFNYDNSTTGNKYAKALASRAGWASSSVTGTAGNTDFNAKRNRTGFTALPAGVRDANQRIFGSFGNYGTWWSSSEGNTLNAWNRGVDYSLSSVGRFSVLKSHGYSVRCLKDSQE